MATNSLDVRLLGLDSSTGTIVLILPGEFVITTILSAKKTASSMSWVTNKDVKFCYSQSFIKSSCKFILVNASRAPKGSSINSILGFIERTLAIATLCFIPPDN